MCSIDLVYVCNQDQVYLLSGSDFRECKYAIWIKIHVRSFLDGQIQVPSESVSCAVWIILMSCLNRFCVIRITLLHSLDIVICCMDQQFHVL